MRRSGSTPQALGVTLFGHRKQYIHKDLEEIFESKQFSRSQALSPEGGYESNQRHDARIDEEPRPRRHPAHGSCIRNPQVFAQRAPNAVAIGHIGALLRFVKPHLQRIGQRRFPSA